jgi:SAM-dependent methyltransferase
MKLGTFALICRTFPQLGFAVYVAEMRRQLAGCRTCLDVGCGPASPIRFLDFDSTVGIDGHEPTLATARANQTHTSFELCDVTTIGARFQSGQFDCCVALDVIEHLTKEDGLALISAMERIATKRILLFTPNGYLPQQSHDGDLQAHLSGWQADEMRNLGFTVIGMHGIKFLRGEYHEHRFKPRALSGIVSVISHFLFTRSHPEQAAALLCVKSIR